LAQDLIRQSLPLSPELAFELSHHLQQSLRDESLAAESHALLGQLCLIRENKADAIIHFKQAAREKPECHLSLAVLYEERGERDKSVDSARSAAAYYEELSSTEPEDPNHRLRWAQAELLAGNFARAVNILEQQLPRVDDPQPFHDLLVDACLAWLGGITMSAPRRIDKQLDILNIAYRHAPDHPRVLALIANLVTQDQDDVDSERMAGLHDALQLAIATGTAPPLVHLIKGTRALEAGNTEEAVTHLELAYKLNADSPWILNNLAWGLAHRDPPEFSRALQLTDAAIQLLDHPNFHGTRAVVLAALGRLGDAIVELEMVLRQHPDPAWVHDRLAELYDQTNQKEIAQLHTRLAAHLRESAKAPE
jgi:tetratricopeptide (TPR) repeat protein